MVATGSTVRVPIGATYRLAQFAAHTTFDDIPQEVIHKAGLLFLDFIGTAIGGSRTDEVRAITNLVCARGGHRVATVLGSHLQMSVTDAAYCNGCAADVLEHQDGYRFGGFHPSHTLPAMLAVAETEDLNGRQLLEAIVAGYEVANRIGAAVHPAATTRGWFPTAAAFGAAAGAGRLLGLDGPVMTAALGGTAFFVPTVFLDAIFGGYTIKPAFAGQLARAGLEGALHAAAGLTGWEQVLESSRGFVALLGGQPAAAELTDGLGTRWTLLDVHQKRYAGCRHTHGAAQACAELAAELDLDPDDVDGVDVALYEVGRTLVDRPTRAGSSTILCTMSLPYVAAVALTDRVVGGAQYDRSHIDDPQVVQLAEKVRVHHSAELDQLYPQYTATEVTVRTRDGTRHHRRVDVPAGDSRAPLSHTNLADKFRTYVAPQVGHERAEQALQMLLGLASLNRVRDLISVLSDGDRGSSTQEECR